MRIAICVLVCAFGVAQAQAQAQAPDKVKSAAAYAEGQRRYTAHDYAAAAAKFIEAYAADPDPAYLFNVAQSFRFAGDCVQAARYYRRFLAAVTSAPNLDKVQVYLAEMDTCIARQQAAPPPRSSPVTPPVVAGAPPLNAPADRGATKRHVAFALGGAGVVAIGVGAWFHRDVGYFESKTQGCSPAHHCTTQQVEHWTDRGRAASSAAIVSYSVGGAALIAGGLLYLLGRGEHDDQAITLVSTPGGALASAWWRF